MPGAHAKLSASGSYRWLACPGSVALEAKLPELPDDEYSLEGTTAHELLALCFSANEATSEGYIGVKLETGLEVTKEMAKAVNVALDHDAASALPDDEVYVEQRVELTKIDPVSMWGTADRIRYSPSTRHLRILDYKHGVGRFVDADDNSQLAYYALGALWRFHNRGVDKVTVTIVQPRSWQAEEPVRSVTYDRADMLDWSATFREGRERTLDPNAPRIPGKHCDYCRGLGGACDKVNAIADDATAKGQSVASAGQEELGRRLREVPILKAYISALAERAEVEARAGRMPVGYKWAKGRDGNRAWAKTEDETVELLRCVWGSKLETHKTELLGPAQIEKQVGKANLEQVAKQHGLIHREPGKPVLVPVESDKPAIDPNANAAAGMGAVKVPT